MRSSKAELPVTSEGGGVIVRETTWGAMHVEMPTFDKEFNMIPLLKGFPDDLDPVPFWGYVVKGGFRAIYEDREEVVKAGDVFYLPPGHAVIYEAGTEFVMFGPAELVEKAAPTIARNYAALQHER